MTIIAAQPPVHGDRDELDLRAAAQRAQQGLTETGRRTLRDVIVKIDVDERLELRDWEDVLLERLAGRWTCKKCGAMYHQLFNPPQEAGVCDRCGGELYQRPDDTPETQKHRIEVYSEQTAPLIQYYREKGLLVEVDGRQGIEDIQADLLEIIKGQ